MLEATGGKYMTTKEQLIRELEQAPESITTQLLSFLHLLQSQTQVSFLTEVESQFKLVDGFMVIKGQDALPNIDWVSFVREERINDLM
jgi:hypothetical protein